MSGPGDLGRWLVERAAAAELADWIDSPAGRAASLEAAVAAGLPAEAARVR